MAATTGGALISDAELDLYLSEGGLDLADLQMPGKAQRDFIDYLAGVRAKGIIPPDPLLPELPVGPPPAPVPRGAPPPPPSGFPFPSFPSPPRINLPSVSDITGGVTSAIRTVLGPAVDFISGVVVRMTATVRDLAESIVPTISELALGIASAVSDGLDFIAGNMAEVGDFAGALAAALITPLEALAETVGGATRDGVLAIIALIFRALSGLGAMLPPLTMERPI